MQKAERVRKQGDKEPEGMTKSRILLYLADHPAADFYDIRIYLNQSMSIRNKKVIRDHLSALEASRLVSRIKETKGTGDYGINVYRLEPGFESLKRVYGYLRDAGLEKEFMKTAFFIGYITSDDFRIKMYLNLYRSNIMYVCDLMKTPEGYAQACEEIEQLPGAQRNEFRGIMKKFEMSARPDDFATGFIALISYFTEDIDTAYESILKHLAGNRRITRGTLPEQYLRGISRLIIPHDQRDQIIDILQVSPGAIDYILEPRFNNPFIAQSLAMGYYLTTILMDPEHADKAAAITGGRDAAADYPIYTMIRSLFISDLINGRLTVADVRGDMLKKAFAGTLTGMSGKA